MKSIYVDDELVGRLTDEHLKAGRTIFQLFQFPGGEKAHSLEVLRILNPPMNVSVLSLGSGVGGMEAYWHSERPDLTFEFVNISPAQLMRTKCPGTLICADLNQWKPLGGFDVVVLSYVLGHIAPIPTLSQAYEAVKPGGKLLVMDIFNCSERATRDLQYDRVPLGLMAGATDLAHVPMGPYARETVPWLANECVPGLFIFEKSPEPRR